MLGGVWLVNREQRLEAELEAYRDAAKYNVQMSGCTFMNWNRSALDRARKLTEKRIEEEVNEKD